MVKKKYIRAASFWLILLIIAIVNAVIREKTYKPLLFPYIGTWAHQISAVTGILAFYGAIYVFLKYGAEAYSKRELVYIGTMWIAMAVGFETVMNMYLRKLNFRQVLETYYFWKGELWIFVLLSLVVSPLIAYGNIMKKR